MSEAPSSAAWKMIEFTRRTSGASETPSSSSRSTVWSSSTSSSWSSSTAARAPNASEARTSFLTRSTISSRLATARASGCRVASFSSSIARTFAGSAIATCRTPPRDALLRRESFAEQRLRERGPVLGGAAAHLRKPVRREKAGRGDQVGEELRARVDAEAAEERGVIRRAALTGRPLRCLQIGAFGVVHPSNEVSAWLLRGLTTRGAPTPTARALLKERQVPVDHRAAGEQREQRPEREEGRERNRELAGLRTVP